MTRLIAAALVLLGLLSSGAAAQDTALDAILDEHTKIIQKGSRKTIQPAIDALADSGLPQAQIVLERWQAKELWARKADGKFFLAEKIEGRTYRLLDILTGAEITTAEKKALKQIKPNSGVRALIGAALVRFQLMDPDTAKRASALDAIERKPEASSSGGPARCHRQRGGYRPEGAQGTSGASADRALRRDRRRTHRRDPVL